MKRAMREGRRGAAASANRAEANWEDRRMNGPMMKRRTLLKGALAAATLPFVPAGVGWAAELTQKYAGTTLNVMLGAGGGSWEAYRQSSEQFGKLTGINGTRSAPARSWCRFPSSSSPSSCSAIWSRD